MGTHVAPGQGRDGFGSCYTFGAERPADLRSGRAFLDRFVVLSGGARPPEGSCQVVRGFAIGHRFQPRLFYLRGWAYFPLRRLHHLDQHAALGHGPGRLLSQGTHYRQENSRHCRRSLRSFAADPGRRESCGGLADRIVRMGRPAGTDRAVELCLVHRLVQALRRTVLAGNDHEVDVPLCRRVCIAVFCGRPLAHFVDAVGRECGRRHCLYRRGSDVFQLYPGRGGSENPAPYRSRYVQLHPAAGGLRSGRMAGFGQLRGDQGVGGGADLFRRVSGDGQPQPGRDGSKRRGIPPGKIEVAVVSSSGFIYCFWIKQDAPRQIQIRKLRFRLSLLSAFPVFG